MDNKAIDRGIERLRMKMEANNKGIITESKIQADFMFRSIIDVLEAMKEPEEVTLVIKENPIKDVYEKWIGLRYETNMMENKDLVALFTEQMWKAIEQYYEGN